MSVPKTRLAALAAAAAATLVATAPAAGRSTLVDDEAPILQRAVAAGLRTSDDNLWQVRGPEAVLGKAREVESVPASSLAGRDATGMAAVLRKAVVGDAGGHYAIVDDLGAGFGRADGDALAAALARLDGEAAPGGGTIARRVHLYLAPAAGGLLTDPAAAGLRTAAFARSGGVWLKTGGWTAAKWLTWPAESARQAAARGVGRARVHVAIGAGDQGALWTAARSGSACGILTNGPGAYRVGGGIEAFAAQYRRTFLRPASAKVDAAGCTAAPVLPPSGASALVAAARLETSALPIPPGGLVTPPLVAGEPAQVTLQLGDDPLGLAAGLGVTPEAAWKALGVIVRVRGPGIAIDVPIAGDGSAPLEFTPNAPGPVTMRLVIRGTGVATALGGPADMVAPLAAAAGGAGLLSRVVADPDGWGLGIPLAPTGGAAGDPVLVIVPPFG